MNKKKKIPVKIKIKRIYLFIQIMCVKFYKHFIEFTDIIKNFILRSILVIFSSKYIIKFH